MYALQANLTGFFNTAAGASALYANTAVGVHALYANTTGNDNTAAGVAALASNSPGAANTASGADALHSNTTGAANATFGGSTLYANTTGAFNRFVKKQQIKWSPQGALLLLQMRARSTVNSGKPSSDVERSGSDQILHMHLRTIGSEMVSDYK